MKAIAVFSKPEGRRKIPDPCLDEPVCLAQQVGTHFKMDSFHERDLQGELAGIFRTGAWDATPHLCAGDKLALHSMGSGKNLAFLWEGGTARSKRQLVHIESLVGPAARTGGGVPLTPAVTWGALTGQKFPGEATLAEDPELAKTHLTITLRLAKASGYPEQENPSNESGTTHEERDRDQQKKPLGSPEVTDQPEVGAGEGDVPEVPAAGIGLGYFSWLREELEEAVETGPLGRGWGRVTQDKRSQYFREGGRMDPGSVRVSGFVYATTEGQTVYSGTDEKDALQKGFAFLETAKFSANLVVEDVRAFRAFSLTRAAVHSCRLPSWVFFPHGRGWLSDLAQYCPLGETDTGRWILRCGVAHGLKTCSPLIVEPALGFFSGDSNPSISAKSYLGAISRSPYFFGGRDRAPELWRGVNAGI
jgi:hypothetical protein